MKTNNTKCVENDASLFNNWIVEKYELLGLVRLVQVKGLNPDYYELVGMLKFAGVTSIGDKVYNTGLGKHIQTIFAMACAQEPADRIAATLGAKTKTIQRFCNRHCIELPQRLLLADLDGELKELVAEGCTISEISAELEFSTTHISKYCKANNIDVVDTFHKGYVITHNGYKLVPAPVGYANPDCKGYVREHRLIMEQHLGRSLRKDEVVHHIDHNKLNNNILNLQLTTLSEHSRYHAKRGDTGWGSKKI